MPTVFTDYGETLIAPRRYRLATFVLAITMFVTGFTGLVFEYVLSTVATYILGNSVEQFSITIGVMLLMMGLGGAAQKFISEEKMVTQFVVIEIILAVLGGFAPIIMYASFGLMDTHFALVQYFLAMAIGFLIGFEVPLAIRIGQGFTKSLPKNLAVIFSLDYVGAFVGALMFSRVLLRNFPLTEMSFILAWFNLAVAFIVFIYFCRDKSWKNILAYFAVIAVSGLVLVWGYDNNRKWNVGLEQRLYKDKIVFAKTSLYQRIVLTWNREKNDEYRLYLNGNLQFSSLDEGRYHDFLIHVPMLFVPKDQKVKALILGGGDGFGLRELLKYPNVQSVTLVDLDPEMVRFAGTHPVMSYINRGSFTSAKVRVIESGVVSEGKTKPLIVEGPRSLRAKRLAPPQHYVTDVSVINIDADKFLSEIQDTVYDVIIVDFPDPRSIELAKLYSKEFYLKLRRVLAEHGIIAVQSTSVYYSKEPFLIIGRTMKAAGFTVVPYHHEVPAFGDWGYHLLRKDRVSAQEMAAKLKAQAPIPVESEYITPQLIANSVDFGKTMLQSAYPNEISTLMQPKLLELYLKSWITD